MAPADARQTKFVLEQSRIRAPWYNIAADLPRPAAAAPPGYAQPIGPDDLAPLFPMELIGQEVSTEREIEIPEPVREAYRLYRPSRCTAPTAWSAPSIRRPTSTTSTRAQSGGQPQAEHGDPAGVLQQAGGRQAPGHRDRCRTVGERAGVRRCAVRARGQGLHGPGLVRPEAVPPEPDGDLRRAGRGQPQSEDTNYGRSVLGGLPTHRLAGHRHQRGGRGRRDPRRHEVLARLRAQPRLLHQTVIGQETIEQMAMAGEEPDDHRLRGRRVQLRRPDVPLAGPHFRGGRKTLDHRRRAGGGTEPDARRTATTSATRRRWPRS